MTEPSTGGGGKAPPCRFCEPEAWASGLPSPEAARAIADDMLIPAASRVEAADYAARLLACEACPDLRANVLCRWCGCFTAVRALWAHNGCPHPAGDRWAARG